MCYRLDVNVRAIRVAMGIEGEGIFSLKVTDAQISLEKHD
jgi:hypothetical protein